MRFIGNGHDVPSALLRLWDLVRRDLARGREPETIVQPPSDLGSATQDKLQALLLDMMTGHGMTSEEARFAAQYNFLFFFPFCLNEFTRN